jgi:hypothetical protein
MSIWRVNVACLVLLASSAIAQDSQSQNEPSLDKTIDYMASVLETGGGDQENTFWGRLQEGNLSPPHQRHGQLRFGEASKGLRH